MIIGERLKGFLKYHNISAKSFAEMIGVTEGMVYKYYKMVMLIAKPSKSGLIYCVFLL